MRVMFCQERSDIKRPNEIIKSMIECLQYRCSSAHMDVIWMPCFFRLTLLALAWLVAAFCGKKWL